MRSHFPNESAAYRSARTRLLEDEIGLRRQMERVAALRRALPPGGSVPQDYLFDGPGEAGQPGKVWLSDLFRPGTDALVIYHYMFPRHRGDARAAATSGETARIPKAEQPCPSCTALLDQLDGAVSHFEAGGGNFAVVAQAPLERLMAVARDRGWKNMRLLSASNNTFKRDYLSQDAEGQQEPLTTVFRREADGTIRLFWASELLFAPLDPGQEHRAAGTVEPLWNLFDLTPGGRPDFAEQLHYGCCH